MTYWMDARANYTHDMRCTSCSRECLSFSSRAKMCGGLWTQILVIAGKRRTQELPGDRSKNDNVLTSRNWPRQAIADM